LGCPEADADPTDDHGFFGSVVWNTLQLAGDQYGITPQQVAANIVQSIATVGEPITDDTEDDGTFSAAALQAALDEGQGYADTIQKALGDDGEGIIGAVVKAESAQRFTLTVAYPVLRKDGHGETADYGTVEKAAWDYLRNSQEIGLWHVDGLVGAGTVVESSIYRGPDWVTKAVDGSAQTIHAGDWLLGVQWDEPGWQAITSGLVDGMSVQGKSRRRRVTLSGAR
jgi:hypothetical protein